MVIFMTRLDALTKGVTVDRVKDQGINPANSRIKTSGRRKGTFK